MKELERTRRISISAVLIIGLLFFGFLGFKMPDNVFKKTNKETLTKVLSVDYFISKKDAFAKDFVANSKLIDIRNEFDYNKGHFEGAINMPTGHLLVEGNIDLIRDFSDAGIDIVLYGSDPEEANAAWMLLYQMDIAKLRILSQKVSFENNKFISKPYQLERANMDYAVALKEATGVAIPDKIAKEKIEKIYIPVYVNNPILSKRTSLTPAVKIPTTNKVHQAKKTIGQQESNTTKINTPTQKPAPKKKRKLRKKKKKKREGGC